jgi:hypothetical protein
MAELRQAIDPMVAERLASEVIAAELGNLTAINSERE